MSKQKNNVAAANALIRAVVGEARTGGYNISKRAAEKNASKRKGGYNVSERDRAYHYRSGVQQALLNAKDLLSTSEYSEFFRDFIRISEKEERRFQAQPKGYDFLDILVIGKSVPLAFELAWVTHRLSGAIDEFGEHAKLSKDIGDALLRGELESALCKIDDHSDRFGSSLWSIELRIGLLQLSKGVADQKKFLADLKGLAKRAMMPYLATYFSRRAEPDVSIGWFLDNSLQRIKRLHADIGTYTEFRINGVVPACHEKMAAILRVEQNHNIIDVYETYISILQNLAVYEIDEKLLSAVKDCIKSVLGVKDFRVAKLAEFFGVCSGLQHPPSSSFDMLIEGKISKSIRRAKKELVENPASIISQYCAAFSRSLFYDAGKPRRSNAKDIVSSITSALIPIIRRENQEEINYELLLGTITKFVHVFNGIPYAKSIRNLIEAKAEPLVGAARRKILLAAFNDRESSIFDVVGVSASGKSILESSALGCDKSSSVFCSIMTSSGRVFEVDASLHGYSECYASAVALISEREFSAAEVKIQGLLSVSERSMVACATPVAMAAYLATGNVDRFSKLISRECAYLGETPHAYPIADFFQGLDWSDFEDYAGQLSLSNTLFLYDQSLDNEKAHSYRCFALETFLSDHGVDRPSKLRGVLSSFEKSEIAFFLGKVCSLDVIDMLPSIGSSREALEERRDVCALLVNSEMDFMGDYIQELVNISRDLAVQKGLQTFDGSRIHVDSDALRVLLKRELQESFNRYLALVKQEPGTPETFEEVLRSLTKSELTAKQLLSFPDSEADELLITMILKVRDRFLFDIPHGLDSYLSKRVRHGSVVGYIRSPAEKEGLITQQGADGRYRQNTVWVANVESLVQRKELDNALVAFSKSIDQHLLRLKDVVLHVRSDDHPLGVFDVAINPPTYRLIRSVVLREKSLDAFISTMLASLWTLLMPSLQAARTVLDKDTLRFVSSQFDALRSKIASILESSVERTRLDMAAGRASVNMQAAVEAVSAWFEPVEPDESFYSADEVVQIAIGSVRAIHSDFYPKVELSADEDFLVSAENLSVLVDVLFIAFGNVAERSGIRGNPDVSVSIAYNDPSGVLAIKVENCVCLGDFYPQAVEKVEKKKIQIGRKESLEMARKEGDSGLIKLASLVASSSNGRLDFGYRTESLFVLEVDLTFVELS